MAFALAALAARTPTVPAITATAQSASSISIALTAPSTVPVGAIAFYLLFRSIAGAPYTAVQSISPAAFPFLDTNLPSSTQVSYFVEAVNNSQNADRSKASVTVSATTQGGASTTPTQPAILATATSSSTISIALTTPSVEPVNGIKNYMLQRSVSGSAFGTIATVLPTQWPYVDQGLSASTAYSYRTFAVDNNAAGTPSANSATSTATTAAPSTQLSVAVGTGTLKNRFVNQNGTAITLNGWNCYGMEVVTLNGPGTQPFFSGYGGGVIPNFAKMATQGCKAVRIPLNQAAWLGQSVVNPTQNWASVQSWTNGQPANVAYQNFIDSVIAAANQAGIYIILDLHWSAPGNNCPASQNSFADADHSIAFWTSVAQRYGYPNGTHASPAVLFELFNEPNGIADSIMANGGSVSNNYGTWTATSYPAMRAAIRATGAANVVVYGGNNFSSNPTWMTAAGALNDSISPPQIAANVMHAYSGAFYNLQNNYSTFNALIQAIEANVPCLATEYGENNSGFTTFSTAPNNGSSSGVLPYVKPNNIGILAWSYNPPNPPSETTQNIVSDANGTLTPWGTQFSQYMLTGAI